MGLPIQRGWLYWADLNPQMGSEPGKVRPVLVIQTDLLNNAHPSTIILPVTSKIQKEAKYLRVRLAKGEGGLDKESDILIDQIRAIDKQRLVRALGEVSAKTLDTVVGNLAIVLDFLQNPAP